jgi:L-threonylcarbamoyladenylate synthase
VVTGRRVYCGFVRLPADAESIALAAEALVRGELVAFPTETVYGLGARADDAHAVRAIYEKKGRPPENPSIVHAADAASAFALALDPPTIARALADAFWPGPLTLVVRVRPGAVASEVTAGGDTVALRVPAHPIARALLEAAKVPIAAPSANRSTRISPTTAVHVEKSLGSDLLVLDAGPTGFGIESTIVDATSDPLVVLRRGSIGLEALRAFGPCVDRGDAVVAPEARPKAPGAFARHYAPSVPVVTAPRAALASEIAELCRTTGLQEEDGGVIVVGAPPSGGRFRRIEVLAADPQSYARELYAALHRLEDAGVAYVAVEEVPEGDAWLAIHDRIRRARG